MKHCMFVIAATLALAVPAEAQPWPAGIEGYLGIVFAGSDNADAYRGGRGGILMDLLVVGALHGPGEAGPVVALNAGMYGVNIVREANCLMRVPNGPCVPWFPGFVHGSVLGGWETGHARRRILIGAGIAGGEGDPTVGLVARSDVALFTLSHISAMATANTLLVPSYRGDTFYYLGLGIGLRLR